MNNESYVERWNREQKEKAAAQAVRDEEKKIRDNAKKNRERKDTGGDVNED